MASHSLTWTVAHGSAGGGLCGVAHQRLNTRLCMSLRCESGHRPHLLEALGVQRTIASLGEKGLSLISISLSLTHNTHTPPHTRTQCRAWGSRGVAKTETRRAKTVCKHQRTHPTRTTRALQLTERGVGRWWVFEVSVFTRVKSTSFVLISLNHQSQVKSVSFITVRLRASLAWTSSRHPRPHLKSAQIAQGGERAG